MLKSKEDSAENRCRQTAQEAVWDGDFGRDYTDRNTFDAQSLDDLWLCNYGVARSTINEKFLSGIAKNASFLEVGCKRRKSASAFEADGMVKSLRH